jgi:hypothetical protein
VISVTSCEFFKLLSKSEPAVIAGWGTCVRVCCGRARMHTFAAGKIQFIKNPSNERTLTTGCVHLTRRMRECVNSARRRWLHSPSTDQRAEGALCNNKSQSCCHVPRFCTLSPGLPSGGGGAHKKDHYISVRVKIMPKHYCCAGSDLVFLTRTHSANTNKYTFWFCSLLLCL